MARIQCGQCKSMMRPAGAYTDGKGKPCMLYKCSRCGCTEVVRQRG